MLPSCKYQYQNDGSLQSFEQFVCLSCLCTAMRGGMCSQQPLCCASCGFMFLFCPSGEEPTPRMLMYST